MAGSLAIEGGFDDQVLDGQRVFRAVMDALASPGTPRPLGELPSPPVPLTPELGALALTLCDHDSPVWLDAALAAAPVVAQWLRFHTGAPIIDDPGAAMFAFVTDLATAPPLGAFAIGTDQYPDRSTTLLVAVPGLTGGPAVTVRGPGIEHAQRFAPLLPETEFWIELRANAALFPLGFDAVLAGTGQVAGLPRTTRIGEA